MTYDRDGSRDAVLTHLQTTDSTNPSPSPTALATAGLRPRPAILRGATYRVPTPVGTAFVTINGDEYDHIREVFVTVGRAGSDVAADAEAIGRLISLILRIPTELPHREVIDAVVDQLSGISGSNALGFGANRVRSLADAVAKILVSHLARVPLGQGNVDSSSETVRSTVAYHGTPDNGTAFHRLADICPHCGQAALIWEEGCRKCYECGFSSC